MAQYKRNSDRFDSKGKGTYPESKPLSLGNIRRTNTVPTGPGSQRKGKKYVVKYDPNANKYMHVYGRGKKAKRVKVRDKTAQDYGYPS